ncbi:TIGR02206 family protein [Leptospira inadai serovar Lyme str. 10]|uniref:TIGR02206 family protein n=2 Tax=Leptospira inadai serovar Lyme TaxID=293084 RepID=V6HS80_9LEPT|nr:TIGR02206 family membrane protein [Leptospira inadai]EQA35439.1 TIGR02206 family protein [Leptospira inadai serovar Lyme str. 10]PNV71658.1 TIGR02206 family membrane protein [Leptospira inadai serovar Lyme]
MESRFEHWSILHIFILFGTVLFLAFLIYVARRCPDDRAPKRIGRFIASILLLNYIVYIAYRIDLGYWEIRYDLPMEFCDWSLFVTCIALFTRNRMMAELSYFWVIAGSINGVVTPDLQVSFPHPYFFIFFIAHSGLVIGALYAVFGLRLYPRKWAVPRVILLSQLYFLSALLIDFSFKANYGYLMEKPGSSSLIDHLGPWPVYLVNMQLIGSALFCILYLPFYFKNKTNETKSSR